MRRDEVDFYERTEGRCSICIKKDTEIFYFLGKDFCLKCLKAKKKQISDHDAEYYKRLWQTI
jgi:hypothetical protein